jgi:hypothetical protein
MVLLAIRVKREIRFESARKNPATNSGGGPQASGKFLQKCAVELTHGREVYVDHERHPGASV